MGKIRVSPLDQASGGNDSQSQPFGRTLPPLVRVDWHHVVIVGCGFTGAP
jgi:hypothetical protein